MYDAIAAVRADRAALLEIGRGLTSAQWQAPSGCPGWRVQDVVAHLAIEFWVVVDPSQLPDITGLPFERAQDILVESRRGRTPEAVLEDYEKVSSTGLEALAGMAALEVAVPMAEAGTYPAAVLPTAYAFDHYTHIRADLFPPRGPLEGEPPPADELRTAPRWTGSRPPLPQQNAQAAAEATLEIEVTAPRPADRLRRGPGQGHRDLGAPPSCAGSPSAATGPTLASGRPATSRPSPSPAASRWSDRSTGN